MGVGGGETVLVPRALLFHGVMLTPIWVTVNALVSLAGASEDP